MVPDIFRSQEVQIDPIQEAQMKVAQLEAQPFEPVEPVEPLFQPSKRPVIEIKDFMSDELKEAIADPENPKFQLVIPEPEKSEMTAKSPPAEPQKQELKLTVAEMMAQASSDEKLSESSHYQASEINVAFQDVNAVSQEKIQDKEPGVNEVSPMRIEPVQTDEESDESSFEIIFYKIKMIGKTRGRQLRNPVTHEIPGSRQIVPKWVLGSDEFFFLYRSLG